MIYKYIYILIYIYIYWVDQKPKTIYKLIFGEVKQYIWPTLCAGLRAVGGHKPSQAVVAARDLRSVDSGKGVLGVGGPLVDDTLRIHVWNI